MTLFRLRQCLGTAAVAVLVACLLAGCDDGKPPLGEVQGTVTLDGQPLPGARISFYPQEGGRSSQAVTDESGRYVLQYTGDADGAMVGMHEVSISTFEEGRQQDDGTPIPGTPEKVPAKYREEGALAQEVKSGKQTIDFALESN